MSARGKRGDAGSLGARVLSQIYLAMKVRVHVGLRVPEVAVGSEKIIFGTSVLHTGNALLKVEIDANYMREAPRVGLYANSGLAGNSNVEASFGL